MVGFSDFDYASRVHDKKSSSDYIFMMAERKSCFVEKCQTDTYTSSIMEAEYVVCYVVTCHTIWLQNFLLALGVIQPISRLLKLFCDNSVAVSFSRNTRSTSRSKHIDVKFYIVKEKVAESLISVEHTPMTSMLVDPQTKGLPVTT